MPVLGVKGGNSTELEGIVPCVESRLQASLPRGLEVYLQAMSDVLEVAASAIPVSRSWVCRGVGEYLGPVPESYVSDGGASREECRVVHTHLTAGVAPYTL
jgi:hypothetical protein